MAFIYTALGKTLRMENIKMNFWLSNFVNIYLGVSYFRTLLCANSILLKLNTKLGRYTRTNCLTKNIKAKAPSKLSNSLQVALTHF
jgi:hypothetical protein